MEYKVHVYVFDNNEQDYVGDIIAREGDTIATVELRILTDLLGPIIGYTVPFELTEVRVTGKRSADGVDFRDPTKLFTDAIREENEAAARVLDYNHFDLLIEIRDRNNAEGGSHKKSNKKRRGGKRKTARKTKRRASKTRRHRK